MHTLEQRARRFASKAHAACNQRRKYTDEPYIVHPASVVERVRSVCQDEIVLAAAWLHDTVEDTPTTLADIHHHFGDPVARLVEMVTNPDTPAGFNRYKRKQQHFAHTALACAAAQTIKLADIIDNTQGIVGFDPHFSRIYLVEKRLQVVGLIRGDEGLFRQASLTIEQEIERLTKPPYNIPAAWFLKLASRYQA
ncbi:hypothetical protein TUM12370_01990 [Salmonella enterica subsp. enterica serovar Choleraesuis]|nr:hypothetical protein TUM12370_01990 [Salmonella enterica subsp. enterica serovar Choleraesuis]